MITVYAIYPEPSGFGAYYKVDNSPVHYPDLETLDDYIELIQQESPENKLIKDNDPEYEEIKAADGHVYYQDDGIVIGWKYHGYTTLELVYEGEGWGMPKIGERYWLIAPSIESESYADYDPRPPWLGQIMEDSGRYYKVSRIGKTGPDEDTNASALVESDQLYTSEAAARDAYIAALTGLIQNREEDLEELRRELRSLENAENRGYQD